MFIFDIEIANPIAPKDPTKQEAGMFYAKSFTDYENMGIACICAYEYTTDKYRVFGEYDLDGFRQLVASHDLAVGFGNLSFDNNVLRAEKVNIADNQSYDILAEIWRSLGSRQKGCKLEEVVKANFPNATGKTMNGADAPIRWQKGYHCEVIDYCINDVRMTKMLMDRILRFGSIKNPINPANNLKIKRP